MHFSGVLAPVAASGWGAEPVLAPAPLERSGQIATGKGELSIRWTDAHYRVAEDRKFLSGPTRTNSLRICISRVSARKGDPDHREEDANAVSIASPPDRDVAAPCLCSGDRAEGPGNHSRTVGRALVANSSKGRPDW